MADAREPLGIIGLGRIGLAAAKVWITGGYKVFGYDVQPTVLKEFSSLGGSPLESPAQVATHSRIVLVLVLNDDQVREVVMGREGILNTAGGETTVICMSTINQATIEDLWRRCREKHIGFVDCPFTGGAARISSASLTLIAAAPAAVLSRVRHVLEVIGRVVYAGDKPGRGQAIKHCNQLLVGTTHAAVMEVITMARKLGLDPSLVATVAGSGIAGSDYFRLLSDSVLRKTPSPGGLGQMCKDMAIVSNTLKKVGMRALVASAASEYFSSAEARGMFEREGADLIEVVEQISAQDNSI